MASERNRVTSQALVVTAFGGLLAASSIGLVSGCSTSDKVGEEINKAQYVSAINSIVADLKQELKLARRLVESGSLREAGPILKQAAARFNAIVDRLQEIDPPAAIRAVHEQFTNALVHFRDVVRTAKDAFQQGDLGALAAGGQELLAFPQRLDSVIADYNREGYAVEQP